MTRIDFFYRNKSKAMFWPHATAALTSAAPFLALTYVDFAPDVLFDDPVALAACLLAVFVLSSAGPPALGVAALSATVWIVHSLSIRHIRDIGKGKKERMYQTLGGEAHVCGPSEPVQRLVLPAPT